MSKRFFLLYKKSNPNNSENRDPNADFKKYGNANAISSAQYFGNGQKESRIDVQQSKQKFY